MAKEENKEKQITIQEATDIPVDFHSFADKKAFERCISCNTYLQEANTEYLIEKAVRRYPGFDTHDVIFEYAMCLSCAGRMRQELSASSLRNIENFFEQRVDLYGRRQEMLYEYGLDHEAWLDRCIVTGKPKSELEEYQIYGHCLGNRFLFSYMPYMISHEAMDEMSDLLSEKTRGEIDRFVDDNFGLPPELKQPIKDHPVLLLWTESILQRG